MQMLLTEVYVWVTYSAAHHVGVTTIEELYQGSLHPHLLAGYYAKELASKILFGTSAIK